MTPLTDLAAQCGAQTVVIDQCRYLAMDGDQLTAFAERIREEERAALPDWLSYYAAADVLTIHGKRYSGALFGPDGFLAPAGTVLRIEDGSSEVVTCTTLHNAARAFEIADEAMFELLLSEGVLGADGIDCTAIGFVDESCNEVTKLGGHMSKLGYTPRCYQGDVKKTGRQWHSGPPPHVGWWNASSVQAVAWWRWWDGTGWSVGVHEGASCVYAGRCAEQRERATDQRCILWTDYWPEGARVVRDDPFGGLTQCDMHEDESR
jgi:hypothetical protein